MSFSFPSDFDTNYDTAGTTPISATSSVTSEGTLVPSMNDAASATAANTTDPTKMLNGWPQQPPQLQNGIPNGFGGANGMMMNGVGSQPQQQFQPGQFPGQQQQQGFRQPGMPGQQPHFNGQPQQPQMASQFASLSHPGAMPNLRQGPTAGMGQMGAGQQQQPQRQQNMGIGPAELQTMQSKALQLNYQHHQRMIAQHAQGVPNATPNPGAPGQQPTPNPGQPNQPSANLGQNLTPYQQQQVMLQYQQVQREQREQQQAMLAQRQAMAQYQAQQGQQPLAPQLSGQQQQQPGQFQAPLAPQNTGGSQHQSGMVQPQHSGQQNGMAGVNGVGAGMPGSVNPQLLYQQAQFKQQQQQMMNGLGQIGRPGTAMGGAINPALMYNNPNMQQIMHQQQQLRQQHFGLQQQQQQQPNQPGQGQQTQPQPDGAHQPPVPPSPALSAASQSQRMGAPPPHMQQQPQQHSTPQMGGAASMPPPSMHPPMQRAQSVLSHGPVDSPSPHTSIQNVRAMTQTPTGMSPPNTAGPNQQSSSHPTPVVHQSALPGPGPSDMSRPMSRMSSSGGPQQNQPPQGWNGPQNGMANGSVDPRALSRMGHQPQQPQQIPPPQQQPPQQPPQQQQQPGMIQRQQSLGGFGPASAATLQGQLPGGANAHHHQLLMQQQALQNQQQLFNQLQQQRPSTPHQAGGSMAPPMQQRPSQDQMHQQLPGQSPAVQSTPRMGAMPPPMGLPGHGSGVPSAPGSVRADSMPPQTPVSATMPGAPGMMNPAANAQMAMMQQAHAARLQQQQQPHPPNQAPQQRPIPTQLPTIQEVLNQLTPAQQQQLMNMPPAQQREQMTQLQMKLMQARQAQAQAQAQNAQAQAAQAQAPMQAGAPGGAMPPGVAPVGMPGAPPNAMGTPGRPVPAGQVPPTQSGAPTQPGASHARPQQMHPHIPPHLIGKVDPRMVVVAPLPFVKDEDDVTHNGQLPELGDSELLRIQRWIQKDKEYLKVVDETDQARRTRTVEEVRSAIGKTRWFEMDEHTPAPPPGQKLTILWPEHKRKLRKQQTGRVEARYPLEYKKEQVDVAEELVPIRLEIEYESHRFRDTLVWNVNDPVATAERFAQLTIEDFHLPAPMASLITKQIQEQLTEHKAIDLPDAMNIVVDKEEVFQGKLEEDDDVWWEGWRKRLRTGNEGQFVRRGQSDDEGELKRKSTPPLVKLEVDEVDAFKPIDVSTLPPPPDLKNNPEIRVMIKLDIVIGPKHLTDQFEWDIMETTNSPELFAETYASELGLGGEFKSAIAHDIREQVNMYQRALVAIGHNFDGGTIFDDDLRQAILPPVSIAGRTADQAANCMPILNNLSEGEMESNEKEREKELKRKKRQGRARRGAIMSEREPLKTHRTIPGCADVGSLLPAPVAISVPSRRQAAVNASQTIASLVAQENNNGYTPALSTPTRDSHHLAPPGANPGPSRANKRQKLGHINPPPLPESVYKPRVKMSPTYAPQSTGVKPPPKTAEQIRADNEARENEQAKPEWHCSTCGCPESIAVGRRKGPKGDKSQCGPCGKFYHRYRRTKDVVYNEDPEFHLRLRQAEVDKRKRKRPVKAGRKSALEDAADFTPDVNSPAHVDDDDDDDDDDDGPPLSQAQNRAGSPPRPVKRIKTPDSSPSPPLAAGRIAEKEKEKKEEKPVLPPKSATPPPPPPPPAVVVQPPPPPPNPVPNVPPFNPETPQWMRRAMQELQAKYENDRFGAIIRPPQPGAVPGAPREWRIKCYDCPGKVYTPGPEETLQNFEVHLKNKRHRENVNARLGNAAAPSSANPGGAAPGS